MTDAEQARSGATSDRSRTPAPSWLTRFGDRAAWAIAAVGFERWARVVAVLVVPLLLPSGRLGELWPAFAGLAVYAATTAIVGEDLLPRYGDMLASIAIILLLGADVLAFLPFLLVAAAGPAVRHGLIGGVAAGGLLGIALLSRLALSGELAQIGLPEVLPIAILLPLGGMTAAAAAQLLQDGTVRDRLTLQRANRLLSTLHELAADLPGGLDAATVSAALIEEARRLPAIAAAAIYADHDGTQRPTSSLGLGQVTLPTLRVDEVRSATSAPGRLLTVARLPEPLREPLHGHPYWIAFPLGGDGREPAGMLVVGGPDAEAIRSARAILTALAADAGIALDNARLFDSTHARAAAAARRWVAADLHDGVAQQLAHLRMELELLARSAPEEPEIARLARVAESALHELRDTIAGLRTPESQELATRLRRHAAELQGERGPRLEVTVGPLPELTADQADSLFRIAQEAISNACRHAEATLVAIDVRRTPDEVVLTVTDDGIGTTTASPQAGGGVGLRSMRDRAATLRGSFHLDSSPTTGTTVRVTLPVGPAALEPRPELQRPRADPTIVSSGRNG